MKIQAFLLKSYGRDEDSCLDATCLALLGLEFTYRMDGWHAAVRTCGVVWVSSRWHLEADKYHYSLCHHHDLTAFVNKGPKHRPQNIDVIFPCLARCLVAHSCRLWSKDLVACSPEGIRELDVLMGRIPRPVDKDDYYIRSQFTLIWDRKLNRVKDTADEGKSLVFTLRSISKG